MSSSTDTHLSKYVCRPCASLFKRLSVINSLNQKNIELGQCSFLQVYELVWVWMNVYIKKANKAMSSNVNKKNAVCVYIKDNK